MSSIKILFYAVATALATQSVCSAQGLEIQKVFFNGGSKVQVAKYTENGEVVVVLNLRTPQSVSFSCHRPLLHKIIDLWEEGLKVKSAKWEYVGALTEVGTTNPSHLVFYGGKGMQLALVDPSVGAVAFTFLDSDKDAFVAALRAVEPQISEKAK